MGMDLKPVRPWKSAPRNSPLDKYDPNGVIWGRYNWSGWSWILNHLREWGMSQEDLSYFSGCNDGDLIPTKTCQRVADLIEKNLDTLEPDDQVWIKEDIILWRTCGGYRQY